MYIEHRSDRVTTQCTAFHGASANPASLPSTTTFFQRLQMALLLCSSSKKMYIANSSIRAICDVQKVGLDKVLEDSEK
jgi:hypothetical protein